MYIITYVVAVYIACKVTSSCVFPMLSLKDCLHMLMMKATTNPVQNDKVLPMIGDSTSYSSNNTSAVPTAMPVATHTSDLYSFAGSSKQESKKLNLHVCCYILNEVSSYLCI